MKLQENHPLAKYSTYQIGGAADFFVDAQSTDEVVEALKWAEEKGMKSFVFGGGSNLLFDDTGFRGLVIRVRSSGFEVRGEEVWAEAGCVVAKVVFACAEAGLTGLEAWNGLPGTVGGAVIGNAGCFGVETKDVLKEATIYIPGQGIQSVGPEWFEYAYRWSRLKREPGVVLSAVFRLRTGAAGAIQEKMKAIARSRIQKQPPGLSTGSFFKNPAGDFAGRLIEACGLKGTCAGKICISTAHANFFMNTGGARSADVLTLADEVTQTVFDRFGVPLEREVVYVRP